MGGESGQVLRRARTGRLTVLLQLRRARRVAQMQAALSEPRVFAAARRCAVALRAEIDALWSDAARRQRRAHHHRRADRRRAARRRAAASGRRELRQRHLVGERLEHDSHRHADADRRAARRRPGSRSSSAPSASCTTHHRIGHLGGEAGMVDLVHHVEAEDLAAPRHRHPLGVASTGSRSRSRAPGSERAARAAALHAQLVALARRRRTGASRA